MKTFYLLLILFAVSVPEVYAQEESVTKIIFIRHAEKDTAGTDPGISEPGKLRAEHIAHLLQDQELNLVLSTPFNRTRETAGIIADTQNLEVKEYNPFQMAMVNEWAEQNRGKTILVVGHSNTVPAYVNLLLGKDKFKQLSEDDYDKMFIVSSPVNGEASVVVINTAVDK
ncbi:MAG: SixA phosphatase family protein [Candidatus Cyclobacteriaceae bacterium M2_1C_046]